MTLVQLKQRQQEPDNTTADTNNNELNWTAFTSELDQLAGTARVEVFVS
jgi:hypothetical protein